MELSNDLYGGRVTAYGEGGGLVALGNNQHGGVVAAFGKSTSSIGHLGDITAYGKEGGLAVIGNGEHGGVVEVFGKDGVSKAALRVKKHGGQVVVSGRGQGQAAMGINEYGNGGVSTWDKNGYRQ